MTTPGPANEPTPEVNPDDRPAPIVANLFTPPFHRGVIQLPLVVHVDTDSLWAEITGMPGLFATGKTPSELGTSLGEAVELYLSEAAANQRGNEETSG